MARKTKKEFLEDFSKNPELARKVLKQMGIPWKEIIERPMDFRDASMGVSGFTYYNETEPFAKRNIGLILDALAEFEQDCGPIMPQEYDNRLNWLAWFALESTIQEIIDYVEQD